jgi:hypothetical protein
VVAGAEHGGLERGHFGFQRSANSLEKSLRRLHHDVDDKFSSRHAGLLALPLEFSDGLSHAFGGVTANAFATIQDAIDGRLADARLQRDLFDQKGMGHENALMGF